MLDACFSFGFMKNFVRVSARDRHAGLICRFGRLGAVPDGASAFGRGLHRRPAPLGSRKPFEKGLAKTLCYPASLLKKAWRKLYAMLYQTSVLCIFTFLLIYSLQQKYHPRHTYLLGAGEKVYISK